MFEKEAEEYTRKNWDKNVTELKNDITYQYVKGSPHFYNSAIKQAFQKGADLGYNKANEWHNLEEDPTDLPKENMKQVIVKLSDGSYEMGYYCIHNNSWWADDCPDYDDELGYYDCNTGEKIYPIKWKEVE